MGEIQKYGTLLYLKLMWISICCHLKSWQLLYRRSLSDALTPANATFLLALICTVRSSSRYDTIKNRPCTTPFFQLAYSTVSHYSQKKKKKRKYTKMQYHAIQNKTNQKHNQPTSLHVQSLFFTNLPSFSKFTTNL